MDDFWGMTLVLLLVLVVFVGFLVRVVSYYRKYCGVRHKRACLSKWLPVLKSGDIILFIAHTHGFTNSLITWDLYSHAGMVVQLGEEIYLSESAADPHSDCFLQRLKQYPGMSFLMRLEHPLTPAQAETLRARAQERVSYPSVFQIMMQTVFDFPTHKKSRHCMQHVAWLLDEIGLTPDHCPRNLENFGVFASSRAVTTLPGQPLGGGTNRYMEIVELLYDLS